jgi:hypothetical protein
MSLTCGFVDGETIAYTRNAWSGHDHVVFEGGLEPLAYLIDGADPWLHVAGQEESLIFLVLGWAARDRLHGHGGHRPAG